MTQPRQQPMTCVEIQRNGMQRIAAIIGFFLMLIAMDVHAHNPHDKVAGLGVSPDYVNDQTLFLATDGALTGWRYQDMLRSIDGGATWTKLPKGMDNLFQFSAIRVSPNYSNDRTVFAATRGGGVYRSTNRGNSWQLFNAGVSNLNVKELKIAGKEDITATGGVGYVLFLVTSSGELYRRSSAQADWSRVLDPSTNVRIIGVSLDFSQDRTVMIADANGNLRLSVDGGFNWIDKENPTGARVHDIAIVPGQARKIFLATSKGIFRSNNSGSTFTDKSGNLPIEAINNVVVSPNYLTDRTIFCTTLTRAVYKSTNGGDSWTLHESGAEITGQTRALNEFNELQISKTFAMDQTVFLSAFDGLFVSTDGGSVWAERQTRQNLITGLALSPYFKDDRRVIATTYNGGGIYTSADSGATWSLGREGWPFPKLPMSVFDVEFVQNRIGSPIVVATRNSLILGISSDFGESWRVLSTPKFPDVATGEVKIIRLALSPDFDVDQEIYFGTRRHGILQTIDGGISWRQIRSVPHTSPITSLAVSPNYAKDRTAFAVNREGQIWRTRNGGDSWSNIDVGSLVMRGWPKQKYMWIAISPQFATDQLALVGTNNGIYRSINGGETWVQMGANKIGPSTVIKQIEFSPNFSEDQTVFVNVRGKGLYRLNLNNAGRINSMQNVGASLLKRNIQFTDFRISPDFAQDATLLGASRQNIYISTNGGITWAKTGHPGQ